MIHLDTHVVVWIVAGYVDRLPASVVERLEAEAVAVSPMVRLELTYLHEIGRLTSAPDRILGELRRATGLVEDATTFAEVVTEAEAMTWTRDPFDRIIAAQAVAAGCPLATADRRIRSAIPTHCVWS